jgi:hypothetical protein
LKTLIRAAAKIGLVAALLVALGCASAQALSLQQVGGEFEEPIYVTSDPGDAGRLFVVERKGRIELVEGGVTTPFADLTAAVGCGSFCEGERGLLSIALAPDFDLTGRLFVDYARDGTGTIHVDELTATGPRHESASEASLKTVLEVPHSQAANHNGGQLQFGPEGALFVSTGDGGGQDDQFHHAQDPASQLGKILRLTPAGVGFSASVWSLGLRNPFRFSFDSLSGDMAIGDVGQDAREEIDFAPAPGRGQGANYGWNCMEGLVAGPATDPECGAPPIGGFVAPVLDYPHTPDPEAGGEGRCAIIGGYVVRDANLGSLFGHYIYSDNCGGTIRALRLPAAAGEAASGDCWTGLTVPGIDSFGEDAAGRVYAVARSGAVFRIEGNPPESCPAPEPTVGKPPVTTILGLRAERRRVRRGRRASLTAFVSPCDGRQGQSVTLLRNGHPNGSRFLSRACTAHFAPRVSRAAAFRVFVRKERGYSDALSRRLVIKIKRRHRHA